MATPSLPPTAGKVALTPYTPSIFIIYLDNKAKEVESLKLVLRTMLKSEGLIGAAINLNLTSVGRITGRGGNVVSLHAPHYKLRF